MKPSPLASVAALLLVGCASSQPPVAVAGPDPPAITPPFGEANAGCPLGVPNTRLVVADTKEGVALTFTTWTRVDELRRRVRDAAALHGPRAHLGLGHAGRHDLGQGHGLRLTDMPVGRATVEDVDLGARLRLEPRDGLQVDELREQVRVRIAEIRASRACE